MDSKDVDLLDELRQADPAATFRADSHWIAHRLSELLEDDPAFHAPQLQHPEATAAVSRRPKLVWLSSAAAVLLLVGGGFFAGNFFATNSTGGSDAMAPFSGDSREGMADIALENSEQEFNSLDGGEAVEPMLSTELSDSLNELAAAPLAEQLSWLTERLDPGLSGTFEFEPSTGSVTFQAEVEDTQSNQTSLATAHPEYEESSLLIAELTAVFAPNEPYRITATSFGDGSPQQTIVEFLVEGTDQVSRTWVLEHDGSVPVSFFGILVN